MTRLLIVDDEKSLCQMLEIAFRKDGLSVETVSSGLTAQKKIESHVYDLIISDIRTSTGMFTVPPRGRTIRCTGR